MPEKEKRRVEKWSAAALWRSNRGFTVRHVYGHGNIESSKLFWSIRKDKIGMINNSTPGNIIFYADAVMRREIAELHKSHRHTKN